MTTTLERALQHRAGLVDVGPVPIAAILGEARSLRRRRRAVVAGGPLLAAAVIAAGGLTLTGGGGQHRSQVVPADPGQDAPYWHWQVDETHMQGTLPHVRTSHDTGQQWLGNGRPDITSDGTAGFKVSSCAPGSGTACRSDFQEQWSWPTEPAALRTFLIARADRHGLAYSGRSPADQDRLLFSDAFDEQLHFPGPASVKKALVALLSGLPEVTVEAGTDGVGRAATVLTFVDATTGDRQILSVDPASATVLETTYVIGEHSDIRGTPAGLPERDQVWYGVGPADSAPTPTG